MGYKIAILGATGAVGREMLKCIEEYNIDVDELRVLASSRSAGKQVPFKGGHLTIAEAKSDSFDGCDFVLGAAENDISRKFAPDIKKSGAIYIDNSSEFRLDEDVPLVVPEVNGDDAFKYNGIIANPNCVTIIALMAVAALQNISPITSMIASSYQAVSGAGHQGLEELAAQEEALAKGEPIKYETFKAQILRNCIPAIGGYKDNGYTSEEMKLQNEGRKILHNDDMKVACTCVRVPVMRSHSIAITVRTKDKISVSEATNAINAFPGVHVVEDIDGRDYPTPLDTTDQNDVYVGRIRDDLTDDKGLCLWCCGDQIRKGAAANAVQIMNLFIK